MCYNMFQKVVALGLLIGAQAVDNLDPCEKELAEHGCSDLAVTCDGHVEMPAWIESNAECTGMSTTYINRQCCGSDCSSLNQVLKVADTDGEKMVNAVCGTVAVEPVIQSLAAYKAAGAVTIADFDDTGWEFDTGTNGILDPTKIVHEYLMVYHPVWMASVTAPALPTDTYIGGQPYALTLAYSDLQTLRFRICDVVGIPSDLIVNIYTAGADQAWYVERLAYITGAPGFEGADPEWYVERADFVASGLDKLGDECLDMVVPVSVPVSGSNHPNTMSVVTAITDTSARVQAIALTVNTAHASPVSFRLESMQLNEYLVTYGE